MVWFQCEDCGENLKKPKLANHFRGCSAQKLSCIDCGVVFNQQSVQGHTQCVSEAEKYGPKNVGFIKKQTTKTSSKENNCDGLDVSQGLSMRAPWSCSLCNVKATSQETLLLHSQGKKHRSKVRSMSSKMFNGKNAVDSNAKEEKSKVSSNELGEVNLCKSKQETGFREDFSQGNDKDRQSEIAAHRNQPKSNCDCTEGLVKEQPIETTKKRKLSRVQDRLPSVEETRQADTTINSGEAKRVIDKVIGLIEASEADQGNIDRHMEESLKRKHNKVMTIDDVDDTWTSSVKWKKLIKRALKNAPDGSLRVKQLRRFIFPSVLGMVKKPGLEVTKSTLSKELDKQIQSSAQFIIDGKMVRLAS